MTALELASTLEGRREGREWGCRCPIHGGRSLFITEKDGRILIVCRAGCLQAEVIKALREMGLWGNGERHRTPSQKGLEPKDDTEKRIERADRLWSGSSPIREGDPVHKYLSGRGITPIPEYPEDLRCHLALDYWSVDNAGKPVKTGVFPCMLAVVRSPQGKPVAIHQTYLTNDGHKAPVESPKKLSKVHDLAGSAVRLFPPCEVILAICEGIEDTLSAWVLWQIPTWACLGTSGMKTFQPPEGIKELLIFADRDVNGAGQKAAMALAQQLEKKMTVRVRIPSGHKDINQLLAEGVTHAV